MEYSPIISVFIRLYSNKTIQYYLKILADTGLVYLLTENKSGSNLLREKEKIFYSRIGDFEVDGVNFEIGGKNKTKKQIKNSLGNSCLVKDGILYGSVKEIPLYLFGFLY